MRQFTIHILKILLVCTTTALFADQTIKIEPRTVKFTNAPIKLNAVPVCNTSVLLGRSPFQVPDRSLKKVRYAPVKGGGFRLIDMQNKVRFNRPIPEGRNILITGDIPIFNLTTLTGMGVYDHAEDKCFPLFGAKNEIKSQDKPDLGTLSLGVKLKNGTIQWMETVGRLETVFRPGYTEYRLDEKELKCSIIILPVKNFCGFICKIKFDSPQTLVWKFGNMSMSRGGKPHPTNSVNIGEKCITLTSTDMPNLKMLLTALPYGKFKVTENNKIPYAQYSAKKPAETFYILNSWGVNSYDKKLAEKMMSRLNTANSSHWQSEADKLKKLWFNCYIGSALNPEKNLNLIIENPEKYLNEAKDAWDKRINEFEVNTPDPYLNSIVEFQRATSNYHVKGPGLLLGAGHWFMYSHISVGWYGKLWSGDLESIKNYMRFFTCLQKENGYINWISPSLASYNAEDNTPYWVEHIWWIYKWSGDVKFLRDMWPMIQKAVEYECKTNDPDDNGLYKTFYAYWNCDSDGQGPSTATPTATAWSMNDKAAKIAQILGDVKLYKKYSLRAEKIRNAAMEKLWNNKTGVLGSIGADGIWRSHPQLWAQYIPIIYGMLPKEKGARAMRWLEAHYGFTPKKDVNLLMSCDWWPIRWSVHWVPTGDTLLAAMAGVMCGDADLWWPYIKTIGISTFKAQYPQIGFSMNNNGVGGGESDLIDAVDPHTHMIIRGMFGIMPDIPNNRFYITPSFPTSWNDASIKTPQISYSFHKEGDKCTITVETPTPMIKVITPYPGSEKTITTKKEKKSVVNFIMPTRYIITKDQNQAPQILTENVARPKLHLVAEKDLKKIEMLDLSAIYNTTLNKLTLKTPFVSDYGAYTTIHGWWGTIPGKTGKGDEVVTGQDGVKFLIKGRNKAAEGKAYNLIALSSWRDSGGKYPLSGSVTIPINKKLKKFWILMQNYVSPIKNYIPNGEITLHYTDNTTKVIQLIPPFNLDTYYQSFARSGASLKLGELILPKGWTPSTSEFTAPNALELPIECDSLKELKSIDVSGTVSEGVIGITAITLLPVE